MYMVYYQQYTLLSGYTPFYGEDQQELFDQIMKGQYEFDEEYWCNISDDGKGRGMQRGYFEQEKTNEKIYLSFSQEHDQQTLDI